MSPPSSPASEVAQPAAVKASGQKPVFRFEVTNFSNTHFAKDPFPKFHIALISTSSSAIITPALLEMRVKISIHNKWADVTSEVLSPHTELVRSLKSGRLEISDLVFQDVSLKHGGHFTLHVTPLDCEQLVAPWKSEKFAIQSVKTHCNKKRKSRTEANETELKSPMMEMPASFAPVHRMVSHDSEVMVSGMMSSLMHPQPKRHHFEMPMEFMHSYDFVEDDIFA